MATEKKTIRINKEDYEALVDLKGDEKSLAELINSMITREHRAMADSETESESVALQSSIDLEGLYERLDLFHEDLRSIKGAVEAVSKAVSKLLDKNVKKSEWNITDTLEADENMKTRPAYKMREYVRIAREEGLDAAQKFKDAGYRR